VVMASSDGQTSVTYLTKNAMKCSSPPAPPPPPLGRAPMNKGAAAKDGYPTAKPEVGLGVAARLTPTKSNVPPGPGMLLGIGSTGGATC